MKGGRNGDCKVKYSEIHQRTDDKSFHLAALDGRKPWRRNYHPSNERYALAIFICLGRYLADMDVDEDESDDQIHPMLCADVP